MVFTGVREQFSKIPANLSSAKIWIVSILLVQLSRQRILQFADCIPWRGDKLPPEKNGVSFV